MLNIRLFALLFIIPLFLNAPALAQEAPSLAQEQNQQNQIKTRKIDSRAQVLQAYLAKYNSPLQYQAQDFIDAADEYNLDWKLVAAIAGTESTFGKRIPGGYNAWGWGIYGDQRIYFKSWRDGIFTVSEGLRKNYFNKGLTDPYTINRVYAASPTWGAKVSYFLADMERFQKEYKNKDNSGLALSLIPNVAGTSAQLASEIALSLD